MRRAFLLLLAGAALACHHKTLVVSTAVPQVRAEAEKSDGEWVYSLWLPNPGGGEPWRVESGEALGLAVTEGKPETLVRWRVPLSAYRDQPYRLILVQGAERYPIRVDSAHAAWTKGGQKTLNWVGNLLRGSVVWKS